MRDPNLTLAEKPVSLITALIAQAKGFPQHGELFHAGYRGMDTWTAHDVDGEIELSGGEWSTIVCTAPRMATLQTWLRNVHNIDVTVGAYSREVIAATGSRKYEAVIVNDGICNHDTIEGDDWDEVFEKALKVALKQINL